MMDLHDRSPAAGRTLALFAVCLAAITMPLTFTGPAVALPSIGKALGGSPVALNWITNAFMLTFGSSLMTAGALADAHGRKCLFLTGIGAFSMISGALAFAPDILWFDLGRAAQGVAAAAAISGGMAALAQEFDGPARILGTSDVAALAQRYGEAFSTLTTMLGAVTVVTALVVFIFLGRREESSSLPEKSATDRRVTR